MSAWPASLPQNQFLRATMQDADAVLRTEMDAGPPSRRNKYTGQVSTMTTRMVLAGDQLADFNEFYRVTLRNGALSFTWSDPATDETVTYAFKGPPRWTLLRGASTPASRIWEGEMELEIQP